MAEKKKLSERKAFNFYRSYFELASELSDKDRLQFYDAIIKYQFSKEEIELTGIAKIAFVSQKHSLISQVEGYENVGLRRSINGTFSNPSKGASKGGKEGASVQEQEQEQVQVQVQEKPKKMQSVWFKEENENENIIEIYKTYPSNCLVKKTRSLGKCEKNKEQIKKLLQTKSKDEIINIIETYKKNCVLSETYMKNFGTFLNNMPDYSEEEQSKPKKVRWTTTIDRGEKEGTEEQFLNQKRMLGEENILSFEYI